MLITHRKTGFSWKLVVIYGSPYEEGNIDFLDELHKVTSSWSGPTLLGGDFNLSRYASDKSNGNINQTWANYFNDWINIWGLIELNPTNRKYTWANNQENRISAKLDRIFCNYKLGCEISFVSR